MASVTFQHLNLVFEMINYTTAYSTKVDQTNAQSLLIGKQIVLLVWEAAPRGYRGQSMK